MPQRRRYATRDELAERVVEVLHGRLSSQDVGDVLDTLAYLGVDPNALVKITVDEDVTPDFQ